MSRYRGAGTTIVHSADFMMNVLLAVKCGWRRFFASLDVTLKFLQCDVRSSAVLLRPNRALCNSLVQLRSTHTQNGSRLQDFKAQCRERARVVRCPIVGIS